jgi:hypothetical protein
LIVLEELYDALRDAGASNETARRAAGAVAEYERRFAKIERDVAVVRWMVAINLAMAVVLLVGVFATR